MRFAPNASERLVQEAGGDGGVEVEVREECGFAIRCAIRYPCPDLQQASRVEWKEGRVEEVRGFL